ncbi:MAG: hypothetical protein KGD58_11955 [Candidatus Lokiarchaeota archaeon]|nr:hypothetical protein [Candidatus Lokiarchaeota archaeon]
MLLKNKRRIEKNYLILLPPQKNQEVVNKYLQLMQDPGMPSSVKSFKIYGKTTKDGTQSKSYLEVEPGKLNDAFTDLGVIMAAFLEIEGYRYEFGIALSVEESLAALQQG